MHKSHYLHHLSKTRFVDFHRIFKAEVILTWLGEKKLSWLVCTSIYF